MAAKSYGAVRLDVDLGDGSIGRKTLDGASLRPRIGGVGTACSILYDEQAPGLDPLAPEALLIIATGPLTDPAVPGGGSLEICGKSPQTGAWSESRLGTDAGIALRKAGVDIAVIRGRAARPSALVIDDDRIEIIDAAMLKGMTTSRREAVLASKLARGSFPLPPSCAAIGPPGGAAWGPSWEARTFWLWPSGEGEPSPRPARDGGRRRSARPRPR
jgi:aldehyde:ferredoxin oxidoreductase